MFCLYFRFYNVVWNKQTKKKHKTWEGDGTIEINNDIAILKVIFCNLYLIKNFVLFILHN